MGYILYLKVGSHPRTRPPIPYLLMRKDNNPGNSRQSSKEDRADSIIQEKFNPNFPSEDSDRRRPELRMQERMDPFRQSFGLFS